MSAIPELITIQDAAKALSLSRSSVYNLIARGVLHRVKLGKSARLRRDDLCRLVAGGAEPEPARWRSDR